MSDSKWWRVCVVDGPWTMGVHVIFCPEELLTPIALAITAWYDKKYMDDPGTHLARIAEIGAVFDV